MLRRVSSLDTDPKILSYNDTFRAMSAQDDGSEPVTVAAGPVTVTRSVDRKQSGVTATYSLSTEGDVVAVRIHDALPEGIEADDVGFHPEYSPHTDDIDGGEVTFDALVWPERPTRVVLGLVATDASFGSPPSVAGVRNVEPSSVDDETALFDESRSSGLFSGVRTLIGPGGRRSEVRRPENTVVEADATADDGAPSAADDAATEADSVADGGDGLVRIDDDGTSADEVGGAEEEGDGASDDGVTFENEAAGDANVGDANEDTALAGTDPDAFTGDDDPADLFDDVSGEDPSGDAASGEDPSGDDVRTVDDLRSEHAGADGTADERESGVTPDAPSGTGDSGGDHADDARGVSRTGDSEDDRAESASDTGRSARPATERSTSTTDKTGTSEAATGRDATSTASGDDDAGSSAPPSERDGDAGGRDSTGRSDTTSDRDDARSSPGGRGAPDRRGQRDTASDRDDRRSRSRRRSSGDVDVSALVDAVESGEVSAADREALRAALGVSDREGGSVDARLDHLQARVEEFGAYAEALSGVVEDYGSADGFVAETEAAIDDLDDRVAALSDDLAAVADRDDLASEADLDAVESTVDALRDDVNGLRTDVEDIEAAHERRLTRVEEDVETLQADARKRHDELTDQVGALRDEVGDLRSEVAELAELRENLAAAFSGIGNQ